jgi:ATP-binding cassette, subfamily B, multidrug efflux pump
LGCTSNSARTAAKIRLELLQTYLMQWTGQKVMFDMRSQIFRHLQLMSPAFFDRNPVGRLVTRVTSDVDALNEMFTSGVLAIFDNVFVLLFIVAIMVRMNWSLALLTLSVIPAILFVTKIFRKKGPRELPPPARRHRQDQLLHPGVRLRHVHRPALQPRAPRLRRLLRRQRREQARLGDAIFAYAWYYPVVELLSSTAIALVIWRGGYGILHQGTHSRFTWLRRHRRPHRLHPVRAALLPPHQDLSEKYNILQAAMAASERVFKLLDTEPTIVSPAHPIPGNASGSIEFRNVWFTYDDR